MNPIMVYLSRKEASRWCSLESARKQSVLIATGIRLSYLPCRKRWALSWKPSSVTECIVCRMLSCSPDQLRDRQLRISMGDAAFFSSKGDGLCL